MQRGLKGDVLRWEIDKEADDLILKLRHIKK